MRSSRRQSNKFQQMASEFMRCALDMNKVFELKYLFLVFRMSRKFQRDEKIIILRVSWKIYWIEFC